jgi:hypothetical protein
MTMAIFHLPHFKRVKIAAITFILLFFAWLPFIRSATNFDALYGEKPGWILIWLVPLFIYRMLVNMATVFYAADLMTDIQERGYKPRLLDVLRKTVWERWYWHVLSGLMLLACALVISRHISFIGTSPYVIPLKLNWLLQVFLYQPRPYAPYMIYNLTVLQVAIAVAFLCLNSLFDVWLTATCGMIGAFVPGLSGTIGVLLRFVLSLYGLCIFLFLSLIRDGVVQVGPYLQYSSNWKDVLFFLPRISNNLLSIFDGGFMVTIQSLYFYMPVNFISVTELYFSGLFGLFPKAVMILLFQVVMYRALYKTSFIEKIRIAFYSLYKKILFRRNVLVRHGSKSNWHYWSICLLLGLIASIPVWVYIDSTRAHLLILMLLVMLVSHFCLHYWVLIDAFHMGQKWLQNPLIRISTVEPQQLLLSLWFLQCQRAIRKGFLLIPLNLMTALGLVQFFHTYSTIMSYRTLPRFLFPALYISHQNTNYPVLFPSLEQFVLAVSVLGLATIIHLGFLILLSLWGSVRFGRKSYLVILLYFIGIFALFIFANLWLNTDYYYNSYYNEASGGFSRRLIENIQMSVMSLIDGGSFTAAIIMRVSVWEMRWLRYISLIASYMNGFIFLGFLGWLLMKDASQQLKRVVN